MAITFTGHWAGVDRDMAAICAKTGHKFTWKNTEYPCVIKRAERGADWMEGGKWGNYVGKVTTRRALFDALPQEDDTITVSGQSFIVGHVTFDDSNPIVDIAYKSNPAPK